MNDLVLLHKGDILAIGQTEVFKYIMDVVSSNGCVPDVTYDEIIGGTKLEFEGEYNDFTLYVKEEIVNER